MSARMGVHKLTPIDIVRLLDEGHKSWFRKTLACWRYKVSSAEWADLDMKGRNALIEYFSSLAVFSTSYPNVLASPQTSLNMEDDPPKPSNAGESKAAIEIIIDQEVMAEGGPRPTITNPKSANEGEESNVSADMANNPEVEDPKQPSGSWSGFGVQIRAHIGSTVTTDSQNAEPGTGGSPAGSQPLGLTDSKTTLQPDGLTKSPLEVFTMEGHPAEDGVANFLISAKTTEMRRHPIGEKKPPNYLESPTEQAWQDLEHRKLAISSQSAEFARYPLDVFHDALRLLGSIRGNEYVIETEISATVANVSTSLRAILRVAVSEKDISERLDYLATTMESISASAEGEVSIGDSRRDILILIELAKQAVTLLSNKTGLSEEAIQEELGILRSAYLLETGLATLNVEIFRKQSNTNHHEPVKTVCPLFEAPGFDQAWTNLTRLSLSLAAIQRAATEYDLKLMFSGEVNPSLRERSIQVFTLAVKSVRGLVMRQLATSYDEHRPPQMRLGRVISQLSTSVHTTGRADIALCKLTEDLSFAYACVKEQVKRNGRLTWEDALDIVNARSQHHQFVNQKDEVVGSTPNVQLVGSSSVVYWHTLIPLDNRFRQAFESAPFHRKLGMIQEFVRFAQEQWVSKLQLEQQLKDQLDVLRYLLYMRFSDGQSSSDLTD